MKRFLVLLLAAVMLLGACGPVADDTTALVETDAPNTDSPETNPPETEPPAPVERFDYTIDVKEDTYVMNKNGSTDLKDTNYGADTEIHIKSNGNSLTRYGYVKFDISSLKGDNDFTCIDLDLTLSVRQQDASAPYAALEVYGADVIVSVPRGTLIKDPETKKIIFDMAVLRLVMKR